MEEMTPQVFESVVKNPQQAWDSNSNVERYPETQYQRPGAIYTRICLPTVNVCWGKQLEFPFQPYDSYFRSIPNCHGNLITLRTWTFCFHFLYPENFYVSVLSNSEILILL